jgi:hypothetical protein
VPLRKWVLAENEKKQENFKKKRKKKKEDFINIMNYFSTYNLINPFLKTLSFQMHFDNLINK